MQDGIRIITIGQVVYSALMHLGAVQRCVRAS